MPPDEPQYTELTILTHAEAVEGLGDILLSLGAKGIAEERRPLQVRVTAYLLVDDKLDESVHAVRERLAVLEHEGLRIGPGTIGLRTVGAREWSEAWKDQFQIQQIAPRLIVAPSWEEYEAKPGESVVVLDPGAAFGTGGHPTTRLCLRALVEHLRPGDRVADVGCGSGILAVTAALLGAAHVVATDNDAGARAVALQNANRNGVTGRVEVIEADLVPERASQFDLIVCNIVSQEVLRLAQRLREILSRGGRFIGSGFLVTALPPIEDELANAGLRIVTTPSEEGWAACVAVRPDRRT